MSRGSIASELAAIGRRFYSRGWVLGTSGNFSAVVSRTPLRLAITASSLPKGQLRAADILECDEHGRVAGVKATGEFRCVGCGYGISIYSTLPRCPMCGTESWEQLQWGFAPPLRSDN